MRLAFVLSILLNLSFLCNAQDDLDSLKSIVQKMDDDTNKIEGYYKINRAYYHVQVDSALKYAKKGLELSCRLDHPGKMVEGYFTASSAYFSLGNMKTSDSLAELCLEAAIRSEDQSNIMKSYYKLAINANKQNKSEALDYYMKSFEIAQSIGEKHWQAYILRDIGLYYSIIGEYEKELEYFFNAEALFRELTDTVYLIHTYCDIADAHRLQDNLKKSLEYNKKALALANILNNIYMNARILTSLASTYSQMNEQKKAIDYYQQGLTLYRQVNSTLFVGTTAYDIGNSYFNLKEYNKARNYLDTAYSIFNKIGQDDSKVLALVGIGRLDMAENRLKEAQIKLSEAESLAKKLELFPQLKEVYEELAKLYTLQNNFKKSNDYLNTLIAIKDTMFNDEKSRQINMLETRYQLKEKDAQIKLQESELGLKETKLRAQKTLNIGIGIIAVLLLAVAILSVMNIRKKKHVNQKLKDLDESKSRFFSNISHEMRNPLTLIMAPLQNLTERSKGSEFHTELSMAYSNSKKLHERVNEILDLSKLESGKMVLNTRPTELYNLVKRIFNAYQSIAQYKKIELEFVFQPEKNCAVKLDIEKFEKILNNLILNAIKYSNSGGKVKLEVIKRENLFEFIVTDNGKGIHQEDLPHIFNRYYQSGKNNSNSTGGTGLGLTLANEYAKLFKGEISVESKINEGSTFTFSAPLVETSENPEIIWEEPISEKQRSKQTSFTPIQIEGEKPKLLIVEDDPEMSHYLAEILSPVYFCTIAPDGLEGIKVLQKQQVDIIISDLMMPNMDGFEFRKKIHKNTQWSNLPFVMLTARALPEDKIAGFKLGIDDYITKPFDAKELFARINNLVFNKLERDKFQKNENDQQIISAEEKMLNKAKSFVIKNIDNPDFTVEFLSKEMAYSTRQLERLLKKYCGLTPGTFIREIRLQKAFQILTHNKFNTIKEVCYEVGFNNPAHFTTIFKERFGRNPSEILKIT